MPNDQPRVCPDHLRARHPRITIRIHEVNIPGDKNVLVIRAPRRKDQGGEECDLKNDERKTSQALHGSDNRKSEIENRKLKWARQDSNLGPRDYESPALTAELQARRAATREHPTFNVQRPIVTRYWEIIADNLSKCGWSWGVCQQWICEGDGSGLLMRFGAKENASSCAQMKS
jgi:hypothetical protein